ncbi:hypothetical protein Q7I34_17810, partial [Aeromonas veronii]|uniref:hypothetical protein n=1 Tax=Aeromonas veronii TaxID=654 RepID=UPI003004015E
EYKITPCSVGQILVPCLKNVRDLALGFGPTTDKKSFERHLSQDVISKHLKGDCQDEVIYKVNLAMKGVAFK